MEEQEKEALAPAGFKLRTLDFKTVATTTVPGAQFRNLSFCSANDLCRHTNGLKTHQTRALQHLPLDVGDDVLEIRPRSVVLGLHLERMIGSQLVTLQAG